MTDQIAEHYANDGIAERVLAAIRTTLPAGAPITVDALSAADQLHGRGLEATKELAALLAPKPGERVLDIGSGVGGSARWIAAKFGCHVTGIDLTAAFCRAAEALNAATGLSDKVTIVEGSALALPFPDQSFDGAYSHNVIMNIADKLGFYREARRVLKPGGALVIMALTAGPTGRVHYPTPWATSAETSFLVPLEEMRRDIEAEGFEIVELVDTSDRIRGARQAYAQRLAAGTAPPLGPHLVMGPRMKEFQLNVIQSEQEGSVRSMAALLRRPA
jgi:ubiquinone/menaquinone biosynthesis C-methylase UbiE